MSARPGPWRRRRKVGGARPNLVEEILEGAGSFPRGTLLTSSGGGMSPPGRAAALPEHYGSVRLLLILEGRRRSAGRGQRAVERGDYAVTPGARECQAAPGLSCSSRVEVTSM